MKDGLTHLDDNGHARMVDVGDKPVTRRKAVATAAIEGQPQTISAITGGQLKKGDALAVARVAGIMAAKKTAELIPLCHPIPLTRVEIEIVPEKDGRTLTITATAETTDRTGIEMEAMTAVTVAALIIYDMAKAIDREMSIVRVQLEEKSGGKSGEFRRSSTQRQP
ncbi:cyclic pyranopterin monophosphate synthase MoaC [Devosia naphthalenivorans]|uniref:cyclic pyranopterin monophosphate synthase MoaC n=1 Tax=Devosia naphthalenivorans TaxID=2082392 RepID=UPI000D3CBD76|nr:cyclic pyranopterin monophosphate synthase MoaC [Devosia naphthalenivorans]